MKKATARVRQALVYAGATVALVAGTLVSLPGTAQAATGPCGNAETNNLNNGNGHMDAV